jgi:hypothetical protein
MDNIFASLGVMLLLSLSVFADTATPFERSPSKIKIHKEGDKVWLEGVKVLSMGERESSVQGAQTSIMQALGEKVDYDYLVGVSGLAFRMQVSKEGLCPSSPNPYCGYICAARSIEALPWKTENVILMDPKPEEIAAHKKRVVDSIDKGIPVKYGWEEDGVIIGYQKNGDEWICLHPMTDKGAKPFVNKDIKGGFNFYPERKTKMPARKDMAIESLRQAIEMSTKPEAEGYYLGLNAWDLYMQKIKDLDQADAKVVADSMMGNAWIYECIVSYRKSAAKYLKMIGKDLPAKSKEHLNLAAKLYEKMASQVLTDKKHCCLDVAPYAWSLKKDEKWTTEMRQEELKRLEKALVLEKSALSEISAALEDI